MGILKEQNVKQQEFELIKKLVMQNPYYEGNEDLLPILCEEVYGKSYLLFKSVKNYSYLKGYLEKVVNSTIITTLKKHSRARRLPSISNMDKKIETQKSIPEAVSIKGRYVYDVYKLEDPIFDDFLYTINEQQVKKLVQLVQFINTENLDKNYLRIFVDRYIYNKSIETIAVSFGLSESEVNQRLLLLADIVCENLYIGK